MQSIYTKYVTTCLFQLCFVVSPHKCWMSPARYGRWVTRRVAVATIVIIWLLAALVSFVPISLNLHRPIVPDENLSKKYPTCALDLTPTYAVVSSCISFYVPCLVMIGIYCRYARISAKSRICNNQYIIRLLTGYTAMHRSTSSPYGPSLDPGSWPRSNTTAAYADPSRMRQRWN